jgi:glycerate dehydrogenase
VKIVVLDGYTLNPGDLSWDALHALGDCMVYDRTPPELTVARARDAEMVLTNKTVLDARVIADLPALRYIGVLATGYNVVDTAAAAARGIPVTNVPAYSTASVAQFTFALLLELCHGVGHHARTVREGRWTASADFAYWDTPLIELDGLTMGIIGLGRIGQAVAQLAQAFSMRVIAHAPSRTTAPAGITLVDLETLFRDSDVVSLHCPLTAQNAGMVNAARLALMKPTAFLLNTARGPLVDAAALADALHAGRLAGAAMDVLAVEPPPADNPLLTAPRCIITPHIAWATKAARTRLMTTAVQNVAAFLHSEPRNVVNGV